MLHIKLHMPAGVHAFIVKYYCRVYTSYTSCDFFTLVSVFLLNKAMMAIYSSKYIFLNRIWYFIRVCFISVTLNISSNSVNKTANNMLLLLTT